MSIRPSKGEPTEATLSRRAARRLARDEKVKARRRGTLALGLITLGIFTGILANSGGGDDKEKLASGNTIEAVDTDDRSAEVGSAASFSGPSHPGDSTSWKVGEPITVRCEGFHPASAPLESGSNLTVLAQEETGPVNPVVPTQSIDPVIPLQAVADAIAGYNNIRNSLGEISSNSVQAGAVYQVPEVCFVKD